MPSYAAPTCAPATSSNRGACQPPNGKPLRVLVGAAGRLPDEVEGREQLDVDEAHACSREVGCLGRGVDLLAPTTHRGNGDDPYASARPQELPPTLDVRAALSGRTRGRLRDIRTEMDRVRADFRNLVDSATVRELRSPPTAPSGPTSSCCSTWCSGRPRAEPPRVGQGISAGSPTTSSRFAAHLNAGTRPFHVVNYRRARWAGSSGVRHERLMDRPSATFGPPSPASHERRTRAAHALPDRLGSLLQRRDDHRRRLQLSHPALRPSPPPADPRHHSPRHVAAHAGTRRLNLARLVQVFDTLRKVTEVPRRAARQPRSLTPEQVTHSSVNSASEPVRVTAWIIWEDGVEELIVGHAIAWTSRAVADPLRRATPPVRDLGLGRRSHPHLTNPS